MADDKPKAPEAAAPGRGRSVAVVLAFALPALAFLLLLGNWQLNRLAWKEGLLATIEERMVRSPEPVDAVLAEWERSGDVDYMPMRADGVFLHEAEQHYLATHEGQSGWYIYTPLTLADGRTVLVNRGFVRYDMKDPAKRDWQPVGGQVSIVGFARNPLSEKPGRLVPDNEPANRIWYWKDFSGMADAMGLDETSLVPFFVDAATTNGATAAGPVGGVTRVSLPNNHLQYAITWFGLAAALLAVTGIYLWRLLRR
ncbi:SURF1 family protein [Hoeflea poritis]|uniref:SURF1-like protein n=1 Tax=Hoeflea poritis TaxID=2993659 RepID=A0ABT4VKY6_9HYPH|nr:SURF1 family protein [Hoeflea poritis]MDA4844815.1 SURF1 family protein [Hoeflea poritis]